MKELIWLDAVGQAELVRRKEITPCELVSAAVERIELVNPTLNAVVTPLFEQAADAARSDRLPAGPFRGVPLLLKDFLCETAGDPYYEGMGLLKQLGWRSLHDSLLAERFRAAGFIVLGKTNVPELAASPRTEPLAFGPTRNPWALTRSPGGSSGGSAAAVAAGMVAVAHGNDGTGSLRIPASCCGLVGLKPSRGRVPVGPGRSAGLLGNVAEHVLTRSVRDAASVLDAVTAPAPGELFLAPPPRRAYRAEVGEPPGSLRIGLLTHDPLLAGLRGSGREVLETAPECVRAVEKTAAILEALGHRVEAAYPGALNGPTGLGAARGIIASSGMAAALDAWAARIGRPIRSDDVEPTTWAAAEEGRRYAATDIHAACQRIVDGVRAVHAWWDSGFDVLVTPTMNRLPPEIDARQVEPEDALWQNAQDFGLLTVPYSFTGQPAISLPMDWAGELPVGVQLVAAWGREDVLIRVAAQLEQAAAWAGRRPSVGA